MEDTPEFISGRSKLKNTEWFDSEVSNNVFDGLGGVINNSGRRLFSSGEMKRVELCCDGVF